MDNTVRHSKIFLYLCIFCLAFFSQAAFAQGDFTIGASPSSLTVVQGNQGTSTITTTVSGGFNAPINLMAVTPYRGLQLTFSFSLNPIPAPGSGSSILQITVGSQTPPGIYPVLVIGNGGGVQRTTTITLTVTSGGGGTYKLSCTPALIHISQGHQGQATVFSKTSGGFNNSITLSSSGAPSGTTISFNPNPIPAPGSGSSMISILVGSSTPTGTYPITITGNGGGVRQTATIVLIVTGAASFSISASPSSLTISQGNQSSTTITTTISNGFNSAITLSASGQPSGVTISFVPNPIPAPGSGNSSMTITVAGNTTPGTYPITVTGNGGGTQQNTTVNLTVIQQAQQSNFTISASPIAVTLPQGNQGSATATTVASGGFSSSVTLSATGLPDGTTVTFNPNPIPAPGAGSSTMTINVGSTTLSGSYPISITGNGGGLQRTATMAVTVTTSDSAGAPFPTPPQAYVDTTWNPPTTGSTWNVGCTGNPTTDGNNLQNTVNEAHPGDIIILQARCVYSGNIALPAKDPTSGQWIYVESSELSSLPPPGQRITPSYLNHMATITTPNTQSALIAECTGSGACTGNGSNYGANHFRFVGLELTSNSNIGCDPGNNPPIACWSFYIYQSQSSDDGNTAYLSDSMTIDRCYVHGISNGANSQDVIHAIGANATNFAVMDSYISDIHITGSEAQGILGYYTPGPVKIVDNYISSTTQEIMFGGAGGTDNPYVPSDIEIRRNTLFKPTSWDSCGTNGTVPAGGLLSNGSSCPSGQGAPNNQWVEKNNLELKNAQRVAITGNTLQNTWVSGQTGSSVLLTVRTSQSGNNAVVDDILFQGNVLSGVDSGVNTLEQDDQCQYTQGCTNPGEAKRNWVNDNLFLISPSQDNYEHVGLFLDGGSLPEGLAGVTDFIFQHNTVLMSDLSTLWASIYTRLPTGSGCPPTNSVTHNVWVLDTAMTRQPTGDCGYQGTTGLQYYMGDPSGDLAQRFYGNVMYVPSFDHQQQWPGSSNDATTVPFVYLNPGNGNYQLSVPDWLTTTDGNVSGMNWNALQQAMNP
ncbi:MAG: hypothetical protein WA655_12780 [Candidatus Korobacteraceae bacterium]